MGDDLDDPQRAVSAALRLLSVRARSRHELTALLLRKGFSTEARAAATEQMAGFGYLDDDRFAFERSVALLRGGRLAPSAVLLRLLQSGLKEDQARGALDRATQEVKYDPLVTARTLLEKRGLWGVKEAKPRARAERMLRMRGFGDDVVERLLGNDALDSEV